MALSYLVHTGLNYGDTRREPGEIVDDIPAPSVKWLVAQGYIEAVVPPASDQTPPDQTAKV